MTNLYEQTRKLVALGCEEPAHLEYREGGWQIVYAARIPVDAGIARAIWEAHAREWAVREHGCIVEYTMLGVSVCCGEREYLGPDLLAGLIEVLS